MSRADGSSASRKKISEQLGSLSVVQVSALRHCLHNHRPPLCRIFPHCLQAVTRSTATEISLPAKLKHLHGRRAAPSGRSRKLRNRRRELLGCFACSDQAERERNRQTSARCFHSKSKSKNKASLKLRFLHHARHFEDRSERRPPIVLAIGKVGADIDDGAA